MNCRMSGRSDGLLILSLFPGIGLLDMAFEEEGFCIVRGPDLLWGGDILRFHPPDGKFDGVIGGPPCQAFSRLRHLVEHNGYDVAPDLITEFTRCIEEAKPRWFLMENVPQAPGPTPMNYDVQAITMNNRWVGAVQQRVRKFWFGEYGHIRRDPWPLIEWAALESAEYEPAVLASGGERVVPVKLGGGGKVKASALGYKTRSYAAAAAALQGLAHDFDLPCFTVSGKIKAIGNGVPLPMGRAIAKAIRQALA